MKRLKNMHLALVERMRAFSIHGSKDVNLCEPRNPPASQVQSPLLSLPAELVLEVIRHLNGDNNTLASLARACQMLQPLCENHIYSRIDLGSTQDLRDLIYAFAFRPARVEAVESLNIFYKYHEGLGDSVKDRKRFNMYVGRMRRLKDWYIESPYDNYNHWGGGAQWVLGDMVEFQSALDKASLQIDQPQPGQGLCELRKLIVHSHGQKTDFWSLGGFSCLFRHPALRYLHISCVVLDSPLDELKHFSQTTPLHTLVFDECEIYPNALRRILETPKALKHLTLGENVHNGSHRELVPRLSTNAQGAIDALQPVSESLERLVHYDPYWRVLGHSSPPVPKLQGPGLRDFHHLTHLVCDPCSFLHQGVILFHQLAPPNLDILRLHHGRRSKTDFFEQLPDMNPYTRLPSLNVLEFVQPIYWPIRTRAAELLENALSVACQPDELRDRHAYAYRLDRQGIRTRLWIRPHDSAFPPYLQGEAVPKVYCLYDSEHVGFMRDMREHEDEKYVGGHSEPELHYTADLKDGDIRELRTRLRNELQTRLPIRKVVTRVARTTPLTYILYASGIEDSSDSEEADTDTSMDDEEEEDDGTNSIYGSLADIDGEVEEHEDDEDDEYEYDEDEQESVYEDAEEMTDVEVTLM